MRILRAPDDLTRQALRRLAGDDDGRRLMAYLEVELKRIDESTRVTMDAATLRINQGASQVLADLVDVLHDQVGVKAHQITRSPRGNELGG